MKIIDKTMDCTATFKDIEVGDVFRHEKNNGVYMKTETVFDDYGHNMGNAVNLRICTLCVFLPDYNVIPLNCECIITNK